MTLLMNRLLSWQNALLEDIDEFTASARMNQYERGVHEPDFGMVMKFAAVLKVPVFDIIEGERAQDFVECTLRQPFEWLGQVTCDYLNREPGTPFAGQFYHRWRNIEAMHGSAIARKMFAADARAASCVENVQMIDIAKQ
eukprot:gene20489-biopygen12396